MKRKALSSRLTGEKIVFFVLLILVLLFCTKHYPELLFVAAPILVILDYLIYYRPNHIEFDENCIFIKRKKGEEIVALKDIYAVKMTGWGIASKTIWKITYVNQNKKNSVRFYPRKSSSGFGDFIKQVRVKNPAVELKGIWPNAFTLF